VKERPILFSGPMVRAILEGRKTQTRRVVDLSRLRVRLPRAVHSDPIPGLPGLSARPGVRPATLNQHGAVATICASAETLGGSLGLKPGEFNFECPYAAGDTHLGDYGSGRKVWTVTPKASRLWVREAFRFEAGFNDLPPREVPDDAEVWYEATVDWRYSSAGRLRPGQFMPRWASRLTLEVTGVRVERLQDISEEDARAEGVEPYTPPHGNVSPDQRVPGPGFNRARLGDQPHRLPFADLWDSINGKRAPWSSNPWVWVVEFRRVEAQEAAA
jgi:hypothetical protein